MRETAAYISVPALNHNLQQVKKRFPKQAILAMVKANAYGHGLIEVARALQQVEGFGVATLEEALTLRQAGVTQAIFLMEGLCGCDTLSLLSEKRLTPVISSLEEAKLLSGYQSSSPLSVWLKCDLGMHRLGLSAVELPQAWRFLADSKTVRIQGIFGHFSHNTTSVEITKQQYEKFLQMTEPFSVPKGLANSAAILTMPDSALQWIRPGLMLYGATVLPGHIGADYDLQPVMTLSAPVIALHTLVEGETVGYDGIWQAPAGGAKIAVLAIGYGDGYPRAASNSAQVVLHEQRASVVGRVSMDMTTVDVTHIPDVAIGDIATLWGKGMPVEEVATACGTIAHACLVGLTQRVPRIFVDAK
jgi:alanine racemase